MAKKPEVEAEVIEQAAETKQPGTGIISWEDQLSKYATAAVEEEQLFGGKFVSLKAGRLAIDGNLVAGNKLDCIVIAAVNENALYKGKYDPNNPQPPVCFAFGTNEADFMEPHKDSSEPQAASCDKCPKNEWKSDPEGGKGKACKNTRRLALLAADSLGAPDKLLSAEQVYIKMPVMSVKEWAKYVHAVAAEHKRPPFAVVTSITTEPDAKSQFKVKFSCKEVVPAGEVLGKLIQCHELSMESIRFPYQAGSNADDAPGTKSEKF